MLRRPNNNMAALKTCDSAINGRQCTGTPNFADDFWGFNLPVQCGQAQIADFGEFYKNGTDHTWRTDSWLYKYVFDRLLCTVRHDWPTDRFEIAANAADLFYLYPDGTYESVEGKDGYPLEWMKRARQNDKSLMIDFGSGSKYGSRMLFEGRAFSNNLNKNDVFQNMRDGLGGFWSKEAWGRFYNHDINFVAPDSSYWDRFQINVIEDHTMVEGGDREEMYKNNTLLSHYNIFYEDWVKNERGQFVVMAPMDKAYSTFIKLHPFFTLVDNYGLSIADPKCIRNGLAAGCGQWSASYECLDDDGNGTLTGRGYSVLDPRCVVRFPLHRDGMWSWMWDAQPLVGDPPAGTRTSFVPRPDGSLRGNASASPERFFTYANRMHRSSSSLLSEYISKQVAEHGSFETFYTKTLSCETALVDGGRPLTVQDCQQRKYTPTLPIDGDVVRISYEEYMQLQPQSRRKLREEQMPVERRMPSLVWYGQNAM